MKLKLIGALALTGLSASALANEVLITSNQPTKLVYRVAHKNEGGETVYGPSQTIKINNNTRVSLDLKQYDLTGVSIISVNDKELPTHINQFDKPKQCSMTTNKVKSMGTIELASTNRSITCRTFGGKFG